MIHEDLLAFYANPTTPNGARQDKRVKTATYTIVTVGRNKSYSSVKKTNHSPESAAATVTGSLPALRHFRRLEALPS